MIIFFKHLLVDTRFEKKEEKLDQSLNRNSGFLNAAKLVAKDVEMQLKVMDDIMRTKKALFTKSPRDLFKSVELFGKGDLPEIRKRLRTISPCVAECEGMTVILIF